MSSRRIENMIRYWIFIEDLKNHNEDIISKLSEHNFTYPNIVPDENAERFGELIVVR